LAERESEELGVKGSIPFAATERRIVGPILVNYRPEEHFGIPSVMVYVSYIDKEKHIYVSKQKRVYAGAFFGIKLWCTTFILKKMVKRMGLKKIKMFSYSERLNNLVKRETPNARG
jgi:hypothetical protein